MNNQYIQKNTPNTPQDEAPFVLSINEKEKLRAEVREYMSEHPLHSPSSVQSTIYAYGEVFGARARVALFVLRTRITRPTYAIPSFLIALLVLGGGVSSAAEGALPGEWLYPVKVSINEEVRGSFARSSEEKAKWDATRAERRLEEASSLLARTDGEIDQETASALAERFKLHTEAFTEKLARIEAEDPERAGALKTRFIASLFAYERVLHSLSYGDGSRAIAVAEGNIGTEAGVEIVGEIATLRISGEADVSIRSSTEAGSISEESGATTQKTATETSLASRSSLEPLLSSLRAFTSERKETSAGGESVRPASISASEVGIAVSSLPAPEDIYAFEESAISESALKDMRISAEQHIERVKSSALSAKLTAENKKAFDERIVRAVRFITDAEVRAKEGKREEAFALYRDGFSYSVELLAWLRLQKTTSTVRLPEIPLLNQVEIKEDIPEPGVSEGSQEGQGSIGSGGEGSIGISPAPVADIVFTRTFQSGTHTFKGVFWGSPCEEESVVGSVREDGTLSIAISTKSTAEFCIMIAQQKTVEVRVEVPAEAKLTKVTIDGQERTFSVE